MNDTTTPEDPTPTTQPVASHLANPKIRLAALIITVLIAALALWAGMSHYRYTQALNERNAAVTEAVTAFEDNQKARQDGSQLLPKTLGDLMFTRGTDRLKLLLSKENPYCNTQLTMPEPENRQIALAQAEVARAYTTECEQHTHAVRESIQEAKNVALRREAENSNTHLTLNASQLQLYVDDEMYLDKDLHLKKEAQDLIDRAHKQKENIKTALKNDQNDQLNTLITDAEKIVTEIKALQEKMDQARSEWTQQKRANRAADNTTSTPAYSADAIPAHENTHANNDTQGTNSTPTPSHAPAAPQAMAPATGNTNGSGNDDGWVDTSEGPDLCWSGDTSGADAKPC